MIRRYLRVLGLLIRLSIQNDAAYRVDFFVQLGAALLHAAAAVTMLWVIYDNTPDLNGWGVNHMLVLLGVFRIMTGGISMFIAPSMRLLMEDVRTGTLDFVLIRPINSQFLVSARRIAIWRLADVVVGVVLAAVGAVRLGGVLPPGALMLFLVMLAAGAVIIYSIWLILGTLSFWLLRVQNLEMIFWNVFEAARYPMAIYNPAVRWMLTYVLPVAFVVTIPAQALIGGVNAGVAAPTTGVMIAAAVAAPAMLIIASAFWRFGLRHYSGASA